MALWDLISSHSPSSSFTSQSVRCFAAISWVTHTSSPPYPELSGLSHIKGARKSHICNVDPSIFFFRYDSLSVIILKWSAKEDFMSSTLSAECVWLLTLERQIIMSAKFNGPGFWWISPLQISNTEVAWIITNKPNVHWCNSLDLVYLWSDDLCLSKVGPFILIP